MESARCAASGLVDGVNACRLRNDWGGAACRTVGRTVGWGGLDRAHINILRRLALASRRRRAQRVSVGLQEATTSGTTRAPLPGCGNESVRRRVLGADLRCASSDAAGTESVRKGVLWSERGGHTCTSSGAPARSSSDTTSRSRRASPGLVVAALHASTTADSAVTPAALGAAGDTTAGEGQMRLWSGGCGKGQALSTYRRTCDELAHGEHVAAGGRGLERVRARRRTVGQRLAHRRRIAGVCRARQL